MSAGEERFNLAWYKTEVGRLCDALEKAQEQNKQLLYEVCKLACESVEREKNLARLEAEVMAACNSVRWAPVTERLPTERGYYLAVVKRIAPDDLGGNNTRVKIMRWMGEDWRYPLHIPKWINEAITETVTHWMPLPELPKGE